MIYAQLCRPFKFNPDKLTQIEELPFNPNKEPIYDENAVRHLFNTMQPDTFFICEGGGLPGDCTHWVTVIRTANELIAFHSTDILLVDSNDIVYIAFGDPGGMCHDDSLNQERENEWKRIFHKIGADKFEITHYDYLELVIEGFWRKVFNKTTGEMWCAGLPTAQGDKAYDYKEPWKKAGIPFKRGVLLFLLTYMKDILGDTPKHQSCQWVIDNYPKYKPMIEAVEQELGLTNITEEA